MDLESSLIGSHHLVLTWQKVLVPFVLLIRALIPSAGFHLPTYSELNNLLKATLLILFNIIALRTGASPYGSAGEVECSPDKSLGSGLCVCGGVQASYWWL